MFISEKDFDEETLKTHIQKDVPIRFKWDERWLKGDEYAHIIVNMDKYIKAFRL